MNTAKIKIEPMELPPMPIRDRWWSRVVKRDDNGCWDWTGAKRRNGYGCIPVGRHGAQKYPMAHRVFYEFFRGQIPEGLVLDHLCRRPCCVNPDHLEPVTIAENTMRGFGPHAINARKTECHRGHPLSGTNVMMKRVRSGKMGRSCRQCRKTLRFMRRGSLTTFIALELVAPEKEWL